MIRFGSAPIYGEDQFGLVRNLYAGESTQPVQWNVIAASIGIGGQFSHLGHRAATD